MTLHENKAIRLECGTSFLLLLANFYDFQVAFFSTTLLHCRNYTNKPHMQKLVDAIYLKRLFQ